MASTVRTKRFIICFIDERIDKYSLQYLDSARVVFVDGTNTRAGKLSRRSKTIARKVIAYRLLKIHILYYNLYLIIIINLVSSSVYHSPQLDMCLFSSTPLVSILLGFQASRLHILPAILRVSSLCLYFNFVFILPADFTRNYACYSDKE